MTNWSTFAILFTVVLISSVWMSRLGNNFFTKIKTRRAFSILDTQFPASSKSLFDLLTGIQKLGAEESEKVTRSLKTQLYVDFIFMCSAYPCIYFLCMKAAEKSDAAISAFFVGLAYTQFVAAFCDITENIFLLRQIKTPVEISKRNFLIYKVLQLLKWTLSLVGLFCSISAMFYFWITGTYQEHTLYYLLLFVLESILFFFFAGKKKTA